MQRRRSRRVRCSLRSTCLKPPITAKGTVSPSKLRDMEDMLAKQVEEGAQPKSDVKVVAEVLTKSRTFLKNVGLKSASAKKKFTKSDPAIAAHVTELEERLERERVQNEAMREELAVIKRESLEAEAARSARNKEIQEMLKKNEES